MSDEYGILSFRKAQYSAIDGFLPVKHEFSIFNGIASRDSLFNKFLSLRFFKVFVLNKILCPYGK